MRLRMEIEGIKIDDTVDITDKVYICKGKSCY
jgi:hypothetical protein